MQTFQFLRLPICFRHFPLLLLLLPGAAVVTVFSPPFLLFSFSLSSMSSAMSMSLLPSFNQHYLCPSSSSINAPPLTWKTRCPPPSPLLKFYVKPSKTLTCHSVPQYQDAITNGKPDTLISERTEIRLGLPSKGRMADDTLALLKVTSFSNHQLFRISMYVEFSDVVHCCIFEGLPIVRQAGQSTAVCGANSSGWVSHSLHILGRYLDLESY